MASIGATMSNIDTDVIANEAEKCVHQLSDKFPEYRTSKETRSQIDRAAITAPRESYFLPARAIAKAMKAQTGKIAREIESTSYSLSLLTLISISPSRLVTRLKFMGRQQT